MAQDDGGSTTPDRLGTVAIRVFDAGDDIGRCGGAMYFSRILGRRLGQRPRSEAGL